VAAVALVFGELFTVFYYHSNYSISVVQLMAETNSRESLELLQSVLPLPGTWAAVAMSVAVGLLSAWLSRRSRRSFQGREWLCFAAVVLIVWSGVRQWSAYTRLARCLSSQSIAYCSDPRNMPHLNTPGVRLIYGLAFNMASTEELEVLEHSVEATVVDSCSYRSPLIVLVIGESYSKHHCQLYRPDYLPTTPRLARLRDEGNLCVLDDVVSPFNLTSNVFKRMFSTWDESCPDDWTQHTLFPAVFRRAGYDVHFVTNQFTIGSTNSWDVAGATIFNRPHLSSLQFTTRNPSTHQYDDELIADIPPVDSMAVRPTLLIVHLIGQHVDYASKYPPHLRRFTADDEQTPFGGQQGRELAAHYDNATLFNDLVVDSIFRLFADRDAVGIYLSDHGEEVYDWRDQFERTNEATITPEMARYQYEVPFMFYLSDRFQSLHPELTDAVRAAAHRPFITTDLPHLLFHLAGIATPEYKERLDLLSPQYDQHRRRILRDEVDYDELIKN
jgi:heptose-I-phosphate ethanolaminephosphotransferase